MGDRLQDWDPVFASTIGTPLEPSNVTAPLHLLLREAGRPRQRVHGPRRCAAFLPLAGGAAPRTVTGILGHSQITLAMNPYAHLSPSLERDAAGLLDGVLSPRQTGQTGRSRPSWGTRWGTNAKRPGREYLPGHDLPVYVGFLLAPRLGLEPRTYRLTAGRSTIELSGNVFTSRVMIAQAHPEA